MMNNSFKFIKYIFYILLIISLSLSITSRVNAESCSTIYNENFRPFLSNQLWYGNGLTSRQITLNNNVSISSGYNTIKGKLYVYSTTKGQTITSNINLTETCTSWGNGGAVYNSSGTITYQDGTQASVDIGMQTRICQAWQESGSTTSTVYYEPTYNIMNMRLTTTNGLKGCIVDSIGNFTCYLNNQATEITGAYIDLLGNHTQDTTIYFGWTDIAPLLCVSDTQTIINNNNQNTNTINNSIQDTNNTLKDDDVSNNDSNSTITSIGNTFDTENDFLLGLLTIPYNFFNGLVNIFENNCTSLNLGSMFGEDLVFPCLSLSSLLGNVFTNVIDVIFCGVIMSAFLRRIVKYYQALLSLDERATQIGGVKIW